MVKRWNDLVEQLEKMQDSIERVQAVIGFDGFLDSIVRVVKNNDFFSSIKEFGEYIASKDGKSCSLEIKQRTLKMGGNAPILANALGCLGVKAQCLGAMGYPEIHSSFKEMSSNCTLRTVAQPGLTTALEFNDGKIMLAQMEQIDEINWQRVKRTLGLDVITEMISASHLIGIVNWSELAGATSIWEGLLEEVLPSLERNAERIFLFDLSDPSNKAEKDIIGALGLLQKFRKYGKVILSININELNVLNKVLGDCDAGDLTCAGLSIKEKLQVDLLVVHHTKCAIAIKEKSSIQVNTLYVKEPKLSTGGGDNFNAGLGLGQLLSLDTELSLTLGNAVAAYYIQNGISPAMPELIKFLKDQNV